MSESSAPPEPRKPRIFLFVNSRWASGDCVGMAMAEDGHVLAGHFSSTEGWSQHDMGFTSDWKHDEYRKHYPDGYEVEWVDDPRRHEGVQAAYALNQKLGEEAARKAAASEGEPQPA